MATVQNAPPRYQLFNESNVKNIAIVIQIPGIDLLSNRPIFTRIKYGDPIVYGQTDIVYGGLRRLEGVRDLLSFNGSSLTLSQRIEPEQGRGSVSTLSLAFIDKNEYMTQVTSPGIIIDEILGKEVNVWLGFEEISYPQDFQVIFRGVVTAVQAASGRIILQFSDPNIKRRQNLFFTAKTQTTSALSNINTVIPVLSTGDFHQQILGPDGLYTTDIETWIRIDDEWMQYGPAGITGPTSFTVTRSVTGPLGEPQTPAAHDAGADVTAQLVIQGNPIETALKLNLSGWVGPYETNVDIKDFVYTNDPNVGSLSNLITLPANVSATINLGMSPGDYLTITGATNPGNNQVVTVVSFVNVNGDPASGILTSGTFVSEINGPAVMSIRSQYDVYPESAGARLKGQDVDVGQHVYIQNTFLGSEDMKFLITSQESGKTFIESELFLPVAAYSLTRQGRVSVGLTTPPIADSRLQILNSSNVLEPKNITPSRGLNNRKFFNQIDWEYDSTQEDKFVNIQRVLNTDSLNIIGIGSILPIKTRGSRSNLGFNSTVDRRSRFLLDRYKMGAITLNLKVNYEFANLIEAGDVVLIDDNNQLKITNWSNGTRNLGAQLFEVINRTLDMKMGTGSLEVISGVGANLQDKFATWSPSSLIVTGSTTSEIIIKDSYGAIFPGDEKRKWTDYIGLNILVHSYDYSVFEETRLIGFAAGNNYKMLVSPPLSFTPLIDYIVDIPNYPLGTDPNEAALYKLIHIHWTPSVVITVGTSDMVFDVGAGDIGKFVIGKPVYTHNTAYSIIFGANILSNEATVTNITGNTVTVGTSLGYTPSVGHVVELIGFPDGGPPYRWL